MFVHPLVEVKSVETDARLPEGNLGQVRAHVALEYRVADAEIGSSLWGAQEAWHVHRIHCCRQFGERVELTLPSLPSRWLRSGPRPSYRRAWSAHNVVAVLSEGSGAVVHTIDGIVW
jgi:hypothetical protein